MVITDADVDKQATIKTVLYDQEKIPNKLIKDHFKYRGKGLE